MSPDRLAALLAVYRDGLLNDTLPFWIPRSIDRECGGYLTALDRDGSVLHTDKPVWVHGRIAWLLATLYTTVERRAEWLELSHHGIEFLNRHCFDSDGRMYFAVTRDGRPLRKRRYLFSEAFAVIALAAYGRAANDDRYRTQALELFRLLLRFHREPGLLEPKTVSATRRVKGLAMPMILIVTAQELRKAVDHPICAEVIADSIREIEHDFVKPDLRCVPETVGPNGEVYDTFEGRTVCPGHSLEAALSRSEKLGARVLVLRVHYLLGETFRLSGDRASADDHQRRARQLLDEVRKEARTDAILARHDLSAVQKSFSQR